MAESLSHIIETYGKLGLRLIAIFAIAMFFARLLRAFTNRLVQISKSPSRIAQQREQQTRAMAGVLYSMGTALIAAVAVAAAFEQIGFKMGSLLTAAGIVSIVVGLGAQNLIKDVANGFFIIFEDQYVIGDLITLNNETGRVEHLTLRRTVLRNAAGAIISVPNSLVGQVANLSRDWSQTFVDVTVPSDEMVGRALATLEKIAGDFRESADWSPAVLDGPRVLGVESLSLEGTTLRLQVRTALNRKDDVARELRRRIKLGFEQARIPLTHTHKLAVNNEAMATNA
jgi:moderate conductance mechanosensitive channel